VLAANEMDGTGEARLVDVVLADRLQFAFTLMFHYLFPIGTMGIAPFIAWYNYRAFVTREPRYSQAARFWTKIFGFNFAAGVVTGIPMEFQFGTNWATFSAKSGAVIGQPLMMEGVYAFFLESVFLGVLLYGRGRVAPTLYLASAVAVWLGSWLSGYFIVVTDAWMQHPVGYVVAADGRIQLQSLAAVLFSPFAGWQYAHVMSGAILAGGFVVAGVGAYYMLAKRELEFGREFVRAGVLVALVSSVLVIFPTGDRNGANVTEYQPVKLAAMEGLFESGHGAPLAIIGMPDVRGQRLIDPIFVPDLLSYLAYGNARANVDGLTAYAAELWPPVELTYYAYHVMVGLGTIFIAVAAASTFLLWRRRLFETPLALWVLFLAMPFPYIANEAGWVTAEVGRQPWIIYGLMKTAAAASPNVVSGETIFTLIGFAGMYFLLGVLFLLLTLREIATGPGPHDASIGTGAPPPATPVAAQ
jgi:cytochrome d ubiquinol oxidase subunit I